MIDIKKELTTKEKIELMCLVLTAAANVVTAIATILKQSTLKGAGLYGLLPISNNISYLLTKYND